MGRVNLMWQALEKTKKKKNLSASSNFVLTTN
jgi:hypothetical protein